MSRTRKGKRRSNKRFAYLPLEVLKSDACRTAPPSALKVLACLAAQYSGNNNGDLTLACPIAEQFGITSQRQKYAARDLLEDRGLILRTRQGGRNKCNLYAVTWWAIDYCGGKLDVRDTTVPSNDWRRWSIGKSD